MATQGKAAYVRSKHQQSNNANEKTRGADGQDEDLPNLQETGDEDSAAAVTLITSAHVRSAMMMANLIEGRDDSTFGGDEIKGGPQVSAIHPP